MMFHKKQVVVILCLESSDRRALTDGRKERA
jgi:hypothetical protein